MGTLQILLVVLGPIIDYIAMNYRPLAMVMFVLPASFLMRNYLKWRDWVYVTFFSNPGLHDARVRRVQMHVKARLERPREERKFMCTARAPWQNLSTRFADYKANSDTIFVGDLRDILSLDEKAMTVRLEPLVDVGMITRWLVPQGYMLATTLEIEEATIGGLACAVGMTTASHKYGLLQETVEEFEIVMGDGELVKARRTGPHSELFHAFPWSHGSLGLLVGLTLKVIPVKKYVRIDYTPISGGMEAYCAKIREVSLKASPADFVEVTCFTRKDAIIMEGTFADSTTYVDENNATVQGKINNLNLWYKPWFYKHCEAKLGGDPSVEFTPTYEYIFRHNRATFWTLKDQLPEYIGNHPLFRFFLGWMTPIMVTFLKLPATPAIREEMMTKRVYQDITLPLSSLEEAISKAGDLFEIWPILVYPSRIYDHGEKSKQGQFPKPRPKDMVEGTNYAMYYDLGVYGIPKQIKDGKPFSTVKSMREMEAFTRKVNGAPFLYADTFMDEKEFSEMFNLELYEKVRAKYNAADHFPHLYAKTSGCQSFDWKQMLKEEGLGKAQ